MLNLFKTILLCLLLSFGMCQAKQLHLYVDDGDHVYLGCFSCSPYDSNSIWNEYGTYGSEYSSKSIWNEYGNYGSEYSSHSPWNKFSSNAPVIVDKEGGFYGYFTCNEYKSKRFNPDLMDFFCKNREYIRDHLDDVYDRLF